jgi:hypothetical protein
MKGQVCFLFITPQDEVGPLQLFLGRPTFFRPFGLYCSACFGILIVSILRPRDPWAMQLKRRQTGEGAGESQAPQTWTHSLREHTPTEKHAGLEASRWQPHH